MCKWGQVSMEARSEGQIPRDWSYRLSWCWDRIQVLWKGSAHFKSPSHTFSILKSFFNINISFWIWIDVRVWNLYLIHLSTCWFWSFPVITKLSESELLGRVGLVKPFYIGRTVCLFIAWDGAWSIWAQGKWWETAMWLGLLRFRRQNLVLDLILRRSGHDTKACQKGVLSCKPLGLTDVSMLGKRFVAVIKELE